MSIRVDAARAYLSRVLHIAWREFVATATTRGFAIGALFPPLLTAGLVLLFPRLVDEKAPDIAGQVALVDPTNQVFDGVRNYLAPTAMARRQKALASNAEPQSTGDAQPRSNRARLPHATQQTDDPGVQQVPQLVVVAIGPDADLKREKDLLRTGTDGRLALAVVDPDAIVRSPHKDVYGSYQLFVRERLDDRLEREIRNALREAILTARVRAAGLDHAGIDALFSTDGSRSMALTSSGERATSEIVSIVLPTAFMLLLFMSIMIGAQGLMTTTIEEKSSRVVEVLLSAVSHVQLMAGKVVGQMGAALVVLVLYAALGILALRSLALLDLLDWRLLGYLLVFFFITYLLVAAIMAAIGSAVSELREAQPLVLPVILLLMLPYVFCVPISRDPNSSFSVALSFLPPVNGFAMLLRITSATPPPTWQVWLSTAIGVMAAWGALWCAGKVFRIGLLMYGKPPNWMTLLSWIRRA